MEEKNNKIVKKVTEELLKLLEINAKADVKAVEDGFDINLETEDSGIVIGYHGDTLEALQLVLSLCVANKLGEFKRVSLEVGEYRKNRSEWLNSLAMETKEKVLESQREVSLYDLKPWERRVVHLILQDDKEVESESAGEGKDRVLVVRPKN